MNLSLLSETLKNEPKFRWIQINKLIYQDLINSWDEASTLPLTLRKILNEKVPLTISVTPSISPDGRTIKALLTLSDGLKIEAVLLKFNERNTVCVSSAVGCPLGCGFCATGKMGFKRNLTSLEIVEQVLFFGRLLKSRKEKITNIVFMGMGEPFLNYDNVMTAIKILHDPEKFNLGARRISVSTAGIIPGIRKFTQENLEVNLAISLHAPNNALRSQLMPINKKYPLTELLEAVFEYTYKTKRKVMFEYLLLKDINDSAKCAIALALLMQNPLYHVNLISYNQTGTYQPSTRASKEIFISLLKEKGVRVTQRLSLGSEINAACGQLALKNSLCYDKKHD